MFGLARNNFDEPMTQKQLLGWGLYLVFVCVSIWATGESLARTYDVPKFITYLVGFVISSTAAAMLSIIKNAISDRRIARLIIGTIVFILVWIVSLLTNAHNFYLAGALDDIRQQELNNAKNQIELISQNSTSVLNQAADEYKRKVSKLIKNMQEQIINAGNPGLGPEANAVILDLEEILGTPITRLDAVNGSQKGVRDLAESQGRLIYGLLDEQVASINQQQGTILSYFEDDSDEKLIVELEECIYNYEAQKPEYIKNVLRRSYAYFNKTYEYITQQFQIPIMQYGGELLAKKLPDSVESIELEHIANSWSYVKRNKQYNQPKFTLAIAMSLVVDLGGFVIFFFMALPSKEYD